MPQQFNFSLDNKETLVFDPMPKDGGLDLGEGFNDFKTALRKDGVKEADWPIKTFFVKNRIIRRQTGVGYSFPVLQEEAVNSLFCSVALTLYDYEEGWKHPFDFDNFRTFMTGCKSSEVKAEQVQKQAFWQREQIKMNDKHRIVFLLGPTVSQIYLGKSRISKFEWGNYWFRGKTIYVPMPSRANLEKMEGLEEKVLNFGLTFQKTLADLGFVSREWKPFS